MVRYYSALMALLSSSAYSVPPLYEEVAHHYALPKTVLYSLALTESQVALQNGQTRPWPWTLNVKGKPYFYDSAEEACQALTRFLTQTESVDIGLTQHNWYWQKSYFQRPCDVFQPRKNLEHAARLLWEGKQKYGSWVKAAGYFHRPAGGTLALQYEERFSKHLQQVEASNGS
ncbi:hypothetical protein [Vibrio mediterranei]|nr:hypothetical protein [Vibrio mediterranei]